MSSKIGLYDTNVLINSNDIRGKLQENFSLLKNQLYAQVKMGLGTSGALNENGPCRLNSLKAVSWQTVWVRLGVTLLRVDVALLEVM